MLDKSIKLLNELIEKGIISLPESDDEVDVSYDSFSNEFEVFLFYNTKTETELDISFRGKDLQEIGKKFYEFLINLGA